MFALSVPYCHPILPCLGRVTLSNCYTSSLIWSIIIMLNSSLILQCLISITLPSNRKIGLLANLVTYKAKRSCHPIAPSQEALGSSSLPRWMQTMLRTQWPDCQELDSLSIWIRLWFTGSQRSKLRSNLVVLAVNSVQWSPAVNTSVVCATSFVWWVSQCWVQHTLVATTNLF